MNCKYHPDVQAVGECRLCGTDVCSECMTIVKGNVLCPECVTQVGAKTAKREPVRDTEQIYVHREPGKNGAKSRPSVSAEAGTGEPKSKFFTFVLSFLPGLGHLYLGLTRQGIELMALFFGSIWMIDILGGFPFAFAIPVLFFYGIFDALQKRDKLARGERVDPNATFFRNVNVDWFADKRWIGWLVIGIGALMLLKQVGVYRYIYGFDDILVAGLLVFLGIWMLQRERKGNHKTAERPNKPGNAKEENPDA
ncbi:hypothetical protein [Effusibacillus lacus]|uniref:B box-type domain-containing protein n=1 Tax=Effusibacillus lacus TaxID=1348429 RepID=A0A292YPI8_9BACL|nr:hypothetical protein [Effusibacillus lacus]TCS68765.1 hypothetical protein EDD64_14015 [Effusibacillus lacus]GAX90683.1 hypothetical protein EFBL_2321 [Effusibacillus lacus]